MGLAWEKAAQFTLKEYLSTQWVGGKVVNSPNALTVPGQIEFVPNDTLDLS